MLKLNDESINQNVLGKIVAAKKIWLEKRKKEQPLEEFIHTLRPSTRSLAKALTSKKTTFIMECKKASPSKGMIRPSFKAGEIASIYRYYADAISVLTEEDFFQGKMEYIPEVRKKSSLPVICKDFIFDPYQLYLARKYHADAVLLMLSVLPDESYRILADIAKQLGLDVITEVSNPEEITRAIALDAQIFGINNRNLRDLTVDLSRTKALAPLIPDDKIKLCESGIYTNDDVRELCPLVNGFLVGSSLTSESNISMACRSLVYGVNKVCGLTRHQDALNASAAGAIYGGLIFVKNSKRRVSLKHATNIVKGVNMKFVGVFANQSIEEIQEIASALYLNAVQLHGSEDPEFVIKLRKVLPAYTDIWKAIPVDENGVDYKQMIAMEPYIKLFLLDSKTSSGFGGTGVSCNPDSVKGAIDLIAKHAPIEATDEQKLKKAKKRIIVAGGLNAQNIEQFAALRTYALDINSGVETKPGIKDKEKLEEAFKAIRNY